MGLAAVPLPQPEPDLTADQLLARAEDLIPALRAQQEEADERGHFSDEILQRFIDAGFYRILQPKLFGGYELDSTTFLEVVYRISAGHPSSGWCFCLSASHVSVVASYFPEAAQRDLIGPKGEFRSPHRAVPAGELTPVDGGYRVTGTWTFSSGIPVSTHFMGNSFIPQPDGPPKIAIFVLPRDSVEILQDWGGGAALGMQGSGSNTVRITDAFVPAHHVIEDEILFGTTTDFSVGTPGTRLHANPRYLGLFDPLYHLSFSAILAGAARAAVDEWRETTSTWRRVGQPGTMSEDPDAMRAFGEAAALADASHAIMRETAARLDALYARWAEDGQRIAPAELMRLHALARQGARTGAEAVNVLFHASGARPTARGSKLQRYFRDVQMYTIHASTTPAVDLARAQGELGLPLTMFGNTFA